MGPRYVLRIFWGLDSSGPWKNETYTHLKVEKCVIVKRLRCLLPNLKRWEKLGYGIVVSSFKQASANTVNLHSSILVYHFWKHAYHFCSTWMTSGMHIEKRGGLVISDWFFGEGMETNAYSLHPFANLFEPFLYQFQNFYFYSNITFLVPFLNSWKRNQEIVPQVLKQVENLSC